MNLMERFKLDESLSSLELVECGENESLFKKITLYKIHSLSYALDSVYFYHQNRFITTITTHEKHICGLVEIADEVEVNLFKTEIEKHAYSSYIRHYVEQKGSERKRIQSISGRVEVEQSRKKKQLNN